MMCIVRIGQSEDNNNMLCVIVWSELGISYKYKYCNRD